MPTLRCLSTPPPTEGLHPLHEEKTNLSQTWNVTVMRCPVMENLVMGQSKLLVLAKSPFAPLSLHQSPPTILLRKIWIPNKFISIYKKILSASNHLFSKKKKPYFDSLFATNNDKSVQKKMLILRTLFPKNVFKIRFSFVIIFCCCNYRVLSIQVETYLN